MNNMQQIQVAMHYDHFEKTVLAINNGFYLEAIFREYAAIEGRLEIILGLLGAPCNKNASDADRRRIDVSHRINCLSKIYTTTTTIGNTKLDAEFFNKLNNWRNNRNIIVHGFYKNEIKYHERSTQNKTLAEDGLLLSRMLYNEAKRLRRYQKSHMVTNLLEVSRCYERHCNMNQRREKANE